MAETDGLVSSEKDPANLIYHEWPDWIAEPPLAMNNIYIHDFVMLAQHDTRCPCCLERKGVLWRDMTPGQFVQILAPCRSCEKKGWRVVRFPNWVLRILQFLRWLT